MAITAAKKAHLSIKRQTVVTSNQEKRALTIQAATSSAFAQAMLDQPEELTLDAPR